MQKCLYAGGDSSQVQVALAMEAAQPIQCIMPSRFWQPNHTLDGFKAPTIMEGCICQHAVLSLEQPGPGLTRALLM